METLAWHMDASKRACRFLACVMQLRRSCRSFPCLRPTVVQRAACCRCTRQASGHHVGLSEVVRGPGLIAACLRVCAQCCFPGCGRGHLHAMPVLACRPWVALWRLLAMGPRCEAIIIVFVRSCPSLRWACRREYPSICLDVRSASCGDNNGPKGQIPEVWPLGNTLFMVMSLPLVSHVHQQNESEEKAEALLSHEMGGPDDPPLFESLSQQ